MDWCFSLFCEQSYQIIASQLSASSLIERWGGIYTSLENLIKTMMLNVKKAPKRQENFLYLWAAGGDGQVVPWESRSPARWGVKATAAPLPLLSQVVPTPHTHTWLPGGGQSHGGKVRSCKEIKRFCNFWWNLMKSQWKPLFLSPMWARHHYLTLVIRGNPSANKVS